MISLLSENQADLRFENTVEVSFITIQDICVDFTKNLTPLMLVTTVCHATPAM